MSAAARSKLSPALQSGTADRLAALDWHTIGGRLDAHGCAVIAGILSDDQCALLTESYGDDALFRSRVVMGRHGFGRGEYKYFVYPLPGIAAALRATLYPKLAQIANQWNAASGL